MTIDLQSEDWLNSFDENLAAITEKQVDEINLLMGPEAEPDAMAAQALFVLERAADEAGITVSAEGESSDFLFALGRTGFKDHLNFVAGLN